MLYLAGAQGNALTPAARPGGSVTASHACLVRAPVTRIGDGDPSTPAIFGSNTVDMAFGVNINTLVNGNFEASLATGWSDGSSGGGAATRTTVGGEFGSGTAGLKLVSGGGVATVFQYRSLSAGTLYRFGGVVRNNGSNATLYYIVYDKKANKSWNGAAWVSGFAGAAVLDTGSFAFQYVDFQVPSYADSQLDEVPFHLGLYCDVGTAFVDRAYVAQGINFVALIGHNVGGGAVAPKIYDSGDLGGAYTLLATMTPRRGAFYSSIAMAYNETWLVQFSGQPHEAPAIGQVVLGQARTCSVRPEWGLVPTSEFPGLRGLSPGLRPYAYNYASDPVESIALDFVSPTAETGAELEEMWLRSAQGLHPTIIVPSTEEGNVYYGRLLAPYEAPRPFGQTRPIRLALRGDPLPIVGA